MRTISWISAIILLVFFRSTAQDCEGFYPMNKGNVMELTSFNEKEKMQSVSTTTITDRSTSADGIVLKMHSIVRDEKGKDMTETDFDARCSGGVFYLSLKNMVSSEQMKAWKDMDMKMSGTDLQIPIDASPGQSLPDGSIQIDISMNGIKMPGMSVQVTDRKVMGVESITTQAGTFSCIKITSKFRTESVFAIEMNNVEWYSKGNGLIRSESYKGDKLKGYTVLTRLVK